MKKHIPNAVTVGKALVAPVVTVWAVRQEWVSAFFLFAVVVAGDMLDGWLAKRLQAESSLGKEIDPFSDAFVSACAMCGLMFQKTGGGHFWFWATLMLSIGIPMKILKHQKRYETLRYWCTMGLPYCYVASTVIMLNIYAIRAFDWGITGVILTIPLLAWASWFKRHRTEAWLAGRR